MLNVEILGNVVAEQQQQQCIRNETTTANVEFFFSFYKLHHHLTFVEQQMSKVVETCIIRLFRPAYILCFKLFTASTTT